MGHIEILRRYKALIELTTRPYRYPSKQKLLDRLAARGFASRPRTLEADFTRLRQEFGIDIAYDKRRRGYCCRTAADECVDAFWQAVL